jgi:hypothetical protein
MTQAATLLTYTFTIKDPDSENFDYAMVARIDATGELVSNVMTTIGASYTTEALEDMANELDITLL